MPDPEIVVHADCRLTTGIITGNRFCFPVSKLVVKLPGSSILGPHLQIDKKYAAGSGGFLQPFNQLTTNPESPTGRVHSQEIEMRPLFEELHHGKSG